MEEDTAMTQDGSNNRYGAAQSGQLPVAIPRKRRSGHFVLICQLPVLAKYTVLLATGLLCITLAGCDPRPDDKDSGPIAPEDSGGADVSSSMPVDPFSMISPGQRGGVLDCNRNGVHDNWDVTPRLFGLDLEGAYDAGEPSAAAADDLDGDGDLDLVVINSTDGTITVFINRGVAGAGRFVPNDPILVGDEPQDLVIAHLDGDEFLDLAVANRIDGTISVLPGIGDGSFGDPVSFRIQEDSAYDYPVSALRVVALDLDATDSDPDYTLDLVVLPGEATDAYYTILWNSSGESIAFEPPDVRHPPSNEDHEIFAGMPTALTTADLDLDGDLDLIIGYDKGNIRLYENNSGFLNFRGTADLGSDLPIRFVTSAKVDEDDVPDLLTIASDHTVSIVTNIMEGHEWTRVGADSRTEQLDVPGSPSSIVATDLDGDGVVDIATEDDSGNRVVVRLGKGYGVYEAVRGFSVGNQPNFLLAAEIDGRGRVDLVTGNDRAGDEGDSMSVLLSTARFSRDCNANGVPDECDLGEDGANDCNNNGVPDDCDLASTISFSPREYSPSTAAIPRIAAFDSRRDERKDVVRVNFWTREPARILSQSRYGPPGNFGEMLGPISAIDEAADAVAVGYYRRAGEIALANFNFDEGWVRTYRSDSEGNWQSDQLVYELSDLGEAIWNIAAANLFDDEGDELIVLQNDRLLLFLNEPAPPGPGGSRHFSDEHYVVSLDGAPTSVASEDLDGDGRRDLIVGETLRDGAQIEVCRNTSGAETLAFAACSAIDVDGKITAIATGRLSEDDTNPAILATDYSSSSIIMFPNESTDERLEFGAAETLAVGPYGNPGPWDLTLNDFDGDGDLDIAVSNSRIDLVSVLRNDGEEGFKSFGFRTGDQPFDLVAEDFDADGRMDLAVGNGNGAVTVLINRSRLKYSNYDSEHEGPAECAVD
jgi:hypothetical protein